MNQTARHVKLSFDPAARRAPPELTALLERAAGMPPLLLVAGEDARRAGVAALGAVALASSWSERGERVVLIDLSLDAPELHAALGTPNDEGISDAVLFGVSFGRVALTPPEARYQLVPAGPYTPEPERVLSSPRLERFIDGIVARQAAPLLYLPADAAGLEAVAARVPRTVVLASQGEADEVAARLPAVCSVEAILTLPGPGAAGDLESDDEEPAEEVVAAGRPRRLSWAAAAVVALGMAAAAWYGVDRFRGGDAGASPAVAAAERGVAGAVPAAGDAGVGGGSGATAAATEPGAVAAQPAPVPVGVALPFSVAIEAQTEYRLARSRVQALRQTEPSVGFYAVPLLVTGRVYYRVMAGPAESDSAAATLMRRLVEAKVKESFDEWSLRPSAYAFDLGEYPTEERAAARAAELDGQNVPTYVVRVPYDDGSVRFQVYAGAYADAQEAAHMRQVLERAGLPTNLVPRSGSPTS